jgi:hypothetical protein
MKSTSTEELLNPMMVEGKAGPIVEFNTAFVESRLKTHKAWRRKEFDLLWLEMEDYAKTHPKPRYQWPNVQMPTEGKER